MKVVKDGHVKRFVVWFVTKRNNWAAGVGLLAIIGATAAAVLVVRSEAGPSSPWPWVIAVGVFMVLAIVTIVMLMLAAKWNLPVIDPRFGRDDTGS